MVLIYLLVLFILIRGDKQIIIFSEILSNKFYENIIRGIPNIGSGSKTNKRKVPQGWDRGRIEP